MFVDISDIAYEVSEMLTIQGIEDVVADEYGLQTQTSLPEINVSCMVVENIDKVLDISTGSYLPKVTYDLYIPYSTVNSEQLNGATVTRGNGIRYTIVSQPIRRAYASHVVYVAVEERVKDDRA